MNIQDLWTHFKAWIVSESKDLIAFLQPFAANIEKGGAQILIAAAESAVSVGFAAPGDGVAKMAAALAAFSTDVAAKGIPYLESQARALIEVALQNAKTVAA